MVTESTLEGLIQNPQEIVELLSCEEDPQTPDPHFDIDKTCRSFIFF
ncbi:hypothetical protein LEP1GSC188_2868 [Leptospira weilii serovar Topaz str. LT2116]|uniref:Uncharacterized protein n=1 Tax=Leptospira weilii serovar Topaz str. LT2116 TaxID=1088540 RepID=M3H118_9LEPT|nr:hypothetical protein LEP1GSC188_2868 [Leptospira weilii serovar Topaz str. LT2116]